MNPRSAYYSPNIYTALSIYILAIITFLSLLRGRRPPLPEQLVRRSQSASFGQIPCGVTIVTGKSEFWGWWGGPSSETRRVRVRCIWVPLTFWGPPTPRSPILKLPNRFHSAFTAAPPSISGSAGSCREVQQANSARWLGRQFLQRPPRTNSVHVSRCTSSHRK